MEKRANLSLCSGIALVVAGVLLYVYGYQMHRVYYYSDYLRAAVSSLAERTGLSGMGRGAATAPRYLHRYGGAGPGFVHSGRLLFYIAPAETTLARVAREAIGHTTYYSVDRLRNALGEINGAVNGAVPAGTALLVPGALPPYTRETRNMKMPVIPRTVGIYYTGHTIGRESIFPVIEKYRAAGVNTIVFDAKDITGIVNYRSSVPAAVKYDTHEKAPIGNVDYLIRFLKERNLYTVARIAVFRDHLLYKKNPDFAIRTADGRPWKSDSGELWCDPTNRHVQEYAIGLAEELAEKGVDEIQFDYIRFPTMGGLGKAVLSHHNGRMSTEEAIADFLKRAHRRISARNARLSIDIFGIVAWGKEIDIRKTGQRIELLAKHCDVISPMLYPSHFNDEFDGFRRPGDNPYHFIYHGCKKVAALAGGTVIRPWLQAFRWRVSEYDEKYIIEQIKASDDAGALGYLFWNASNNYDTVHRALAMMKAGNGSAVAVGDKK